MRRSYVLAAVSLIGLVGSGVLGATQAQGQDLGPVGKIVAAPAVVSPGADITVTGTGVQEQIGFGGGPVEEPAGCSVPAGAGDSTPSPLPGGGFTGTFAQFLCIFLVDGGHSTVLRAPFQLKTESFSAEVRIPTRVALGHAAIVVSLLNSVALPSGGGDEVSTPITIVELSHPTGQPDLSTSLHPDGAALPPTGGVDTDRIAALAAVLCLVGFAMIRFARHGKGRRVRRA